MPSFVSMSFCEIMYESFTWFEYFLLNSVIDSCFPVAEDFTSIGLTFELSEIKKSIS